MPKSGPRARRRNTPARSRAPEPPPLLERLLGTAHLAQVIPQLPPAVLHRVIQSCGLEDCAELVALATAEQLAAVFDLDLWRTAQAGLDEQFDADRFGVWLEVLMESGAAVAADKLAEMDVDLVIAALGQHIRVFDQAAGVRIADDALSGDVGGYRLVARRTGAWNAIGDVLAALAASHPVRFNRVMRGCLALSNSKPEVDGLDDLLTAGEQAMVDLAFNREQRRDKQGYVTPPQARAFLQMSRRFRHEHDPAAPANPVARAYFQALEAAAPPDETAGAVGDVITVLLEAGVLPPPPRALLEGAQGESSRLSRIQACMQSARDDDPAAYLIRSQELAYLANTIVAGCSIQARPFSLQEATEAAVAVCNLGLENWPTPPPDTFLVEHGLVNVFQAGWTVLYEQVCLRTAKRLVQVLTRWRCDDRETQAGLHALRTALAKHARAGAPWRARDALDVIATLDMPAWAALLGLIGECPVMHAGIGASLTSGTRAVSASAFEFISENRQIAAVDAFMQALPETLRG